MIYAGIGSRETPGDILDLMELIARRYATYGWLLRSGRARGADTAFEVGAAGHSELFVAGDDRQDWHDLASAFHPAWDRCSPYAKLLHARNGAILLGRNLDTPVTCVVCWTKDGKATGGTGQALRIAAHPTYDIPIFNLHNPAHRAWYQEFVQ